MPEPSVQQKRSNAPSKRVPFVVRIDGAKAVSITGEFTGWSEQGISLSRGSSGEWQTALTLAPGEYQYRLRIDGRWQDHPEAKKRVPNPFGTENCVLTVT